MATHHSRRQRKHRRRSLGSPDEGTNDLGRLTHWRIGIEGTASATAPFTGKIQLANLAWGRLPAVSNARSLEGDGDGDGLSDIAEDRNQNGVVDPGETAASLADTDSDGASDGDEAIAGTAALDASSRFQAAYSSMGESSILQWQAVPGRSYEIESLGI